MSIDLSWSASSLQQPVHAELEKINRPRYSQNIADQQARLEGRIGPLKLGGRMPDRGPWAQRAQDELRNRILGATLPAQPLPTGGTLAIAQPAGQPATKPGTNVTASPVKITQPGIDPALSTAIPEAKTDGVPKLAPMSGWMSPGGNFQIR
jgi:hypothetical protein